MQTPRLTGLASFLLIAGILTLTPTPADSGLAFAQDPPVFLGR